MWRPLSVRAFAITALLLFAGTIAVGALAPEPVAYRVGAALILALVGGGLAAWFIVRRHDDELRHLEDVTRRLADGDFSVRVRSLGGDTVPLGRSIDAMAAIMDARVAHAGREGAQLRGVLDAMSEAVLVTDRGGHIVQSNAALVALLGHDGQGLTLVEAIRSSSLADAVARASRGSRERVEFEHKTSRDTHTLAAQVAPLEVGVIVVLHDVTELRRAADVRREFVANASHELRTPLTSIRGFAETLADGALEQPGIAKRFVNNILENSRRLEAIVDDLLELSRSESPDVLYGREPVELDEAVLAVLSSLEGRAKERNITLSLVRPAQPVVAAGDAKAIDHVVINLVENAIKYTVEGDTVTISLDVEDEQVIVRVRDHGPGIAPHHLERVFERFYRIDRGRARNQGGTGLGLAIVKHLVARMNGDVSVSSMPGDGAEFVIRLPRWVDVT